MEKSLDNFFANKEPIEPIEQNFRIIFSDGTFRVIRSKGGLQYDQNKIPICMMGTAYDITERVHLEQQDKQHLNELAHVTRLGLMGQMASGIAHEVNQPLCAIANYTQVSINLIKTENPNLVKLTEVLFKSQEQALRAGQIIHRMKEFGKSQIQKHVTTDINALIYNATDFCITELKHNHIKPIFDLSNDLLPVFVDHIQIEQVIINLIKNSIDALQDLPPNIQRQLSIHSFLASNNAIQVSVKDNGLGIDENEKQKILTPFHTTKKDGTGMGLSISRSLIEAYGGTLYFNSELGKGSTFYFTLPIETAERG
jgi:C4-dicarboxylate-specific signal transduction histidine kinase